MQNVLKSILVLSACIFGSSSCNQPGVQEHSTHLEASRTEIVEFRGEKVAIEADFPKQLLDQTQESFDRYYSSLKGESHARKNAGESMLTYNELSSILAPLIKKYPDLSWEREISKKDLTQIYKDFLTITTPEEAREKLETVHAYYEVLLKREVVPAVISYEKEKRSNGRTSNLPSTLTEPEKNHLLNHPLKAQHYVFASNDATQFTLSFIDPANDDGNKGNAFRHSAWNALAIRYVLLGAPCSKNEAIEFVRKGTSAHEEFLNGGQQTTDNTAMDLHNNMSARRWMEQEVTWGIGPFRKVPNVTDIINKMLERANSCAVQSKVEILNWYGGENQNAWNHLYKDNTSSHQHLVRLK
jgi:hypothetical protein